MECDMHNFLYGWCAMETHSVTVCALNRESSPTLEEVSGYEAISADCLSLM